MTDIQHESRNDQIALQCFDSDMFLKSEHYEN